MIERTQIAMLSALLGLSLGLCLSLWLDSNSGISRFLFPAILGSLTALGIAFIAYPWQKGLDRKADFESERRKARADFIEGWFELSVETKNLKFFEFDQDHFLALPRAVVRLLDQGKSVGMKYLMVCPNEDVEHVEALALTHEEVLKNLMDQLNSLLEDEELQVVGFKEMRKIVRNSVDEWTAKNNDLFSGIFALHRNSLRDQ